MVIIEDIRYVDLVLGFKYPDRVNGRWNQLNSSEFQLEETKSQTELHMQAFLSVTFLNCGTCIPPTCVYVVFINTYFSLI